MGQSITRTLWRCRSAFLVLCALAVYALALPSGWVYAASARYRTSPERVPPAPVALVLGAGAQHGQPSFMLVKRLELAQQLYTMGKVKVLLVSGDNGRRDYDEPTVMRDFLTARGVPAARIVLDHAGFSTWDSCVRAKQIFGVDRAVVVTQNFHLPRAVSLCRGVGIDAWGVGDDSSRYAGSMTRTLYVREMPAAVKAFGETVFRPRPRFLGPQEAGVARALDTPG